MKDLKPEQKQKYCHTKKSDNSAVGMLTKMTPKEKAEFSEANQIDWYPIDQFDD